jgi:hypothetical protein
VDLRTGLDNVEIRKFLILSGLELRSLGRPVRSQSLSRFLRKYRIRYMQTTHFHMFWMSSVSLHSYLLGYKSPLKVNRRVGGTCRLLLQGGRVSEEKFTRIACGGRSFLTLVLPVSTGRLSLVTPSNPPPCLKFYFCAFKVTHGLVRSYVTLAIPVARWSLTWLIFRPYRLGRCKSVDYEPTTWHHILHNNRCDNLRPKKQNCSWNCSKITPLPPHHVNSEKG